MTPFPTLQLFRHRYGGMEILTIQAPDETGHLRVLMPSGLAAELAVENLKRDWEAITPAPAPAAPRLSDRAYRLLWLTAAHVADVGPNGMLPTDLRTLASVAGLRPGPVAITLDGLIGKGLVREWPVPGSALRDIRYVPSIAGYKRLGTDAPSTEQMRAGRTS